MIPLAEPVLAGNEWRYIKECLDTGWVSSVGSFVNRFEEEMAKYLGVAHGVAVVNGTAALHLSLIIAGVKKDDIVLVPTLTFIAPVNTVRYVGAYPVFFDCDPETLCLDVNQIAQFLSRECERRGDGMAYYKKTGQRVGAVIPVNALGHPADMDALMEVCRQYKVCVIEDATESLGSEYKGKKAGALGNIGCLSFNGNKIITTGGGGMLVTNNGEWAARVRHLSTQAKKDPLRYDHDEIGYNYRLTNIQAALGVAQLEKLEEYVTRKREIAARYRELFAGIGGKLKVLQEASWAKSNYWLSTIQVDPNAKEPLMQYLIDQGIQARPIWNLIHELPMYKGGNVYGESTPHALHAWQTCLNIPCSVNITNDQIETVAGAIKNYFS
ncbi:LegC family aminotransferase [Candidatus Uhrbacteria bacterium]|nr:LegC family aminotransferase [Candidatus Uhrbacteria bacterium]